MFDDDLFDNLAPTGTVWYTLDGVNVNCDKPVRLQMAHAGRSNPPYANALLKVRNEARARSGGVDTVATLADDDAIQVKLYAQHVVKGWANVNDKAGKPIALTVELVEELLLKLARKRPDMVNRAAAYAADADNFITPSAPPEAVGKP